MSPDRRRSHVMIDCDDKLFHLLAWKERVIEILGHFSFEIC